MTAAPEATQHLPPTRADARTAGARKYFAGRPCKRGHVAPRTVSDGGCVACHAARGRAQWLDDPDGVRDRRKVRCLNRRSRDPAKAKAQDQARNVRVQEAYHAAREAALVIAWAKSVCRQARRRARRKGVPFSITPEYVAGIAGLLCPVLGLSLLYRVDDGRPSFGSASMDRVIPALGYVPGNVAVIPRRANLLKNNATPDELRRVAEWAKQAEDDVRSTGLINRPEPSHKSGIGHLLTH